MNSVLDKSFENSEHPSLWAYLWLLNVATKEQIKMLRNSIENNSSNVFEEFVWAMNFLDANFGTGE